jgi:hypothetical protein
MRRGILYLALAAALTVGACAEQKDSYTHVQNPPAPLLGSFESYASPSEVRKLLPNQLVVTVVEDSKLPADDMRPRFDVLDLRIEDFEHLGHRGELRAHFLNERLLGTWFYPDSYDTYIAALRRAGLSPVSENTRVGRYTDLWTYRDFEDRSYVAWEDIRLADEQRRWIMRYS